jgi:formylglycine-generating enzyme required for sulfatase activity
VANSQYALFLNEGGYSRQELWSEEGWQWLQSEGIKAPGYWRNPEFNAPNQPVVAVSWWEAEAFCQWAGVRLPRADEAEAAARGPQGFQYPWGNEWEARICNTWEARVGGASAVGIFPRDRSPFGLMDMAGNVWEWCADGDASGRSLRGGGWGLDAGRCRSTFRGCYWPGHRSHDRGFRVATVLPGE